MIKKTLYFGNPAYLSLKDKQLVIKLPEVEKSGCFSTSFKETHSTTRAIEDIGVLILDHQQITLTQGVLGALLDSNVAVITCDRRSLPVGLMLPLYGHSTQNERFREQITASVPLRKQLWQQTIQAKIANQAVALEKCTEDTYPCMKIWSTEVRSGDTENMEARAAAFYWKHLFKQTCPKFKREREGESPNHLLNYGYAILRAVVARALVCAGLLPTLGIHHHNRYNAYCLADDLMEPYRPYVDILVHDIVLRQGAITSLNKESKAQLLAIPTIDVCIGGKTSPLMVAAGLTASSLRKCFSGIQRKILYPLL